MSVTKVVILVTALLCTACASNARVSEGLNQTGEIAPACVTAVPLDSIIHDTREVTTKPQLRAYPDLHYPDRARREKITGSVVVSFVVGADGLPEASSIRAIGGFANELNNAAAEFVGASRYWPGCLSGRPVRVRTTQEVNFRIGAQ